MRSTSGWRRPVLLQEYEENVRNRQRTIETSIVWLDMRLGDLSVLDDKCVALTSSVSKDLRGIEGEIQSLRKRGRRVGQESNLQSCELELA